MGILRALLVYILVTTLEDCNNVGKPSLGECGCLHPGHNPRGLQLAIDFTSCVENLHPGHNPRGLQHFLASWLQFPQSCLHPGHNPRGLQL
jgi:hypothetical protein